MNFIINSYITLKKLRLGIILHDFEKNMYKELVFFAKKWETNLDLYRSLLNHKKNDGKAT